MIDIGISKIIVISIVALIVIGPKRLPATAKAIGILWARIQNYIAKLKYEVNQHVNLEEINLLKQQALEAKHNFQNSLSDMNNNFNSIYTDIHATNLDNEFLNPTHTPEKLYYKQYNGRYSWRLKRSSMPVWYKQKYKIRCKIQNGAARMKRFQYMPNIKQHFWF